MSWTQFVMRRACVAWLCYAATAALCVAESPSPNIPAAQESELPMVIVDLADGGSMRVVLLDELLNVTTPHGALRVPAREIRYVELGLRVSQPRLDQLQADLKLIASVQPEERAAAVARIEALGEPALPWLDQLAKNTESDLGSHAADLAASIKKSLADKPRRPQSHDIITTHDSRILGTLSMPALQVRTTQFGELALKVTDARKIRGANLPPLRGDGENDDTPFDKEAQPDPGNLSSYAEHVGRGFAFHVTGGTDGSLWGTDEYTTDSDLSSAAVHAGVLKDGEAGVVRVEIIPAPAGFTGSSRNGVTSNPYGTYPAAYRFVKKKPVEEADAAPAEPSVIVVPDDPFGRR